MIDRLFGKIVELSHEYVVLDVNGIGVNVSISLNTFNELSTESMVMLYTYLHVSKDSMSMYGFYTNDERDVFLKLISVNSVGPKTAMIILTTFSTQRIVEIIGSNDVDSLKGVKGISTKTAQRIILELFNRIELGEKSSVPIQLYNDAVDALVKLGYARKVACANVEKILKESKDITLEDLIKSALVL